MQLLENNIMRDGTWGPRCGDDGVRTYAVTRELVLDQETLNGPAVLSLPGLPVQFVSRHPFDDVAICKSIEAAHHEEASDCWIVTYGYSNKIRELEQGSASGSPKDQPKHEANPLDRSPKISISTKLFKKTILKDLDGFTIKNTAGVPFAPYQIELPRKVIDVERNLPEFDDNLMNECVGGVNVVAFIGYAERRIKCENASVKYARENGVGYAAVRAQFIVGNDDDILDEETYPDGWWYDWKLNCGFEYLDPNTGKLRPILVNGQRPAQPMLLTLGGALLNSTGRFVAGGAAPIWLGFRVLRDAPLKAIGLFT